MRVLLALSALSCAAAAGNSEHNWKREATLQAFEGVLEGFFLTDEFPNLRECADEGMEAYGDLKKGVESIEKMTVSDVKAGLHSIGSALHELKSALHECEAGKDDLVKFERALEQVKHPLSFALHVGKELLLNGKDIYAEVTAGVKHWKAQEFRAAGKEFGAALELLLVGPVEARAPGRSAHKSRKQITLEVFEGVFEGFFVSDEFPHVESCAKEGLDAYADLKEGFESIKKMTPSDIKAGLHSLSDAFHDLKDALVDCKAVAGDLHNFEEALRAFKSPISFAFHLGKELLLNGKDIYHEVTAGVAHWHAEEFRAAGKEFGTALEQLIVGEAKQPKLKLLRAFQTAVRGEAAVAPDSCHYEDPNDTGSCLADETGPIKIQGIDGSICAPSCSFSTPCPTDACGGATATPQCALQDQSGHKYCALICSPDVQPRNLRAGDAQCGGGKASCKPIQGLGICTYDS